jgi:hypothetical protein
VNELALTILSDLMALALIGAPVAVLLAKPLRRHRDPRLRSLGGAIAMLGLWLTFDVSIGAIWGAIIRRHIEDNEIVLFFVTVGVVQIPAAWISGRIAFGESGQGVRRVRGVPGAGGAGSSPGEQG